MAAAAAANPNIVNPALTFEQRAGYWQLLYRFSHLLALTLVDLSTRAAVEPMQIHTFGQPVVRSPIKLPPAHREFLRKELQEARAAGLITTGASAWLSPCFVVPKPWSTKLRVVLDYRWLNAQTIRDSYPLPHIPLVLETVGRFAVFNKLDLKSGFW